MIHLPECPRCGTPLEPGTTRFHEPFDTYWRCPVCRYSCNADLSPTNWHNILANELDLYAKEGKSYKDNLANYIHMGMEPKLGLQRIQKFDSDFLDSTITLHKNIDAMLSRPANQSYRVKFNLVYGLTEYNFAQACVQLQQYKFAEPYIQAAMKYVPSNNPYFPSVLALSEEIDRKIHPAISDAPPPPPEAPSVKALPKAEVLPKEEPLPKEEVHPTFHSSVMPLDKEENIFSSSTRGCFIYIIAPFLLLLGIGYLMILILSPK